jgi:hypothetical protein
MISDKDYDLVCVSCQSNGHDLCYMGPDHNCPYCEKRMSEEKEKDEYHVLMNIGIYDSSKNWSSGMRVINDVMKPFASVEEAADWIQKHHHETPSPVQHYSKQEKRYVIAKKVPHMVIAVAPAAFSGDEAGLYEPIKTVTAVREVTTKIQDV